MEWFDWLGGVSGFVVEHSAGRFSVRRETAGNGRGDGYWRAYRGRRRVYLGATRQVTANALEVAGRALGRAGGGVPPARERAVARPRLRLLLERSSRLPVTLVCAPAGFGKTTMLATWARVATGRVAWVSLDGDHSEPVVFFQGLARALGVAVPGPESSAALRRRVGALVEELTVRPATVVLDDYHVIESPDVHAAVEHLVERLPARAHVVIATRRPPPLPLARWRSRGWVADVDAGRLRFTQDESVAFLNETMGLQVAAGTADGLHAGVEGWPAGLQLAALALARGVPAERALSAAKGDLDAYLVSEVLERLPDAMRRFVLATCVLPSLYGPLCEALTGQGEATLRELVEHGLFVVPLDGEGRWFRYHQLFAAAVAEHAEPGSLAVMHRRAARWHEANGSPREAVEHTLAAGDVEEAACLLARLAEQGGELWLHEGRVGRWLAELPQAVIEKSVVLSLLSHWTAWLDSLWGKAPGHPVVELPPGEELPLVLRGVHSAFLAHQIFAEGAPDEAVEAASTALDLLPLEQAPLRGQCAIRLIDVLWHGTAPESTARAEREFARLNVPSHDAALRLDALAGLAMAHLSRGDLKRTIALCRKAAELADSQKVDAGEYLAFGPLLVTEALLEQGRMDGAAPECTGDPGIWFHRHRLTADICAARGDEQGAFQALDELDGYVAEIPFLEGAGFGAVVRRSAAARRAYVCLSFGYAAEAGRALEFAQKIGIAGGRVPVGLDFFERLVAARLALAEGKRAVADAVASEALRLNVLCAGVRIRLLLTAGLARGDAGAVAEALVLGAPGSFVRPFLELGAELSPLLGRAAGPERFLRRVRTACAGEPPVLTRREREVLVLLADGLSAPEAARRLGLATSTVRSHLERVHAKLGARTQAQAVARAVRLGLL
ncbi:LuxR C-terminal-related transcriptional regulator [Actinomadura rubrisoli]|uniref:HTH luxR-type domain-containing protein n=1 Tax=Actinomadura rubrisoli TaxID=2530368 RepID=A0A4R5A5Q6_9ACTN|nr:LuxR C-terminal-related transcriptional regulator [Actinomadura rubrisoli]TDD66316.1 hypothetical protein E1298_40520 [Actinomadura rubrisoli]